MQSSNSWKTQFELELQLKLRTMVMSTYKLKFRTDLEKSVLINNWEKRGWTRSNGDDDWNVYWALPHNVKGKIFNPDSGIRLSEF